MGLRAFQIPADLSALSELIPPSFQYPENEAWNIQQDEVDSMVDSMEGLRRIWPLLRVLQLVYPPLRDLLRGFMWEEDGEPVGMVNMLRSGSTDQWLIGNVAVLPAFRRRGIGRKLVMAAVEGARARGAKRIVLDVVAGNVPAYELYESLGFEHFDSSVELAFDTTNGMPQPVACPEEYVIGERKLSDWKPGYELARRITPDRVSTFKPVEVGRFRQPRLLVWLMPVLGRALGVRPMAFLARCVSDDRVVAAVAVAVRRKPGGVNQVEVMLDPAHGDLAPHLVNFMLRTVLGASPGRRITLHVPQWQEPLLEAALAAGFERRSEFHSMGIIV